ncbi:DUF4157 domain-containing protein [Enterovibrio makurazakiensis]|uniref:eCIS core domain-containing protein n=1 Tax=Enterovibrio makurazakiensis TaxID=2910232 RepID=UPI003D25E847
MRTFAEKPKANQQATSPTTALAARPHFGRSHEANSFLHFPRTIGYQPVQQFLQRNTENNILSGKNSPHFGHDFSGTPIFPTAARERQSKLAIKMQRDEHEQETDEVAILAINMPDVSANNSLQRSHLFPREKEQEDMRQTKRFAAPITPFVQRDVGRNIDEDKEEPHRDKSTDSLDGSVEVGEGVEPLSKRGSNPLLNSVRSFMEPRLGADFSRWGRGNATAPVGGEFERDADALAERVLGEPISYAGPIVEPPLVTTPAIWADKGSGTPLSDHDNRFFSTRLGIPLDHVRIHTDESADRTAHALNAYAFTVGHHIGFASGEYAPATSRGLRLLAHELSHAVLHENTGRIHMAARYSSSERTEMSSGTVTGGTLDTTVASERGFVPGDIVFRMGSASLGAIINEPVTHGGIYIGNGLIHDMVGFGNRNVRLTDFYLEADDPSVIRIIRFSGPNATLIISRLLANINSRNFRLPTDAKPWNLFSSATDYKTATCLEYSHAQFLHAINELSADTRVPAATRRNLRTEYFASGASSAKDLISPQSISQSGTPQAPPGLVVRGLIGAADYLAEDVDSSVFENRWEGTTTTKNFGTSWFPNHIMTATLQAFTYQSFVDSRRYFTNVAVPALSSSTSGSQLLIDAHAATSDSDIRSFVSSHTSTELGSLPVAEKVRMISRLLEGWIADADVVAIETICRSVSDSSEMVTIDARIQPKLRSMKSLGQRIRVRIAISRRP